MTVRRNLVTDCVRKTPETEIASAVERVARIPRLIIFSIESLPNCRVVNASGWLSAGRWSASPTSFSWMSRFPI
jgi:hypothetical protein